MDGTRSALIIASDQYTDPGLRQLRAPASDARALSAVLRDPAIGGFDVRTLLNEPAHVVNLAVEEFFADRQPADLLLMHFSGHGIKDQDGELYFAASNTVLGRLGATAVAAEFVNRRMSRSRSRRVVLLLDCCYAGAFERGLVTRSGTELGIEQQLGGRGRAVITASSAMEYAFEAGELTGEFAAVTPAPPSVFTSALVQGLQTGDADRDQDGLIGLDELYDYVYDQVRAVTPSQTPGKWTFGMEGELYIARRGRPVSTPAALQPELRQALESPLAGVRAGAVQELAALLRGRHAGRALAARLALEQLTRDDSRAVAAAATAALAQAAPEPVPAIPAAPPAPEMPPLPATPPPPAAPPPSATLPLRAARLASSAAAPPREDRPPAVPGGPDPGRTTPSRPRPRRTTITVGAASALAVIAAVVAVILFSGKPHASTPGRPTGSATKPPAAGSQAWAAFATHGPIWSTPTVVNGVVYFGSEDDYVYAVNATSGKQLWSYKTGGMVQSSPAVMGGVVYVGSDNGMVYALRTSPTVPQAERLVWSYLIGGSVWSPALSSDGSLLFAGSGNGDLYELRTAPGLSQTERFVRIFQTGPIRSAPVVVDNVVYVGSKSGLYAVQADGTVLWSDPAVGWVDSNPTVTVVGGVVYFGNHNDTVYALDASNGHVVRQYPIVGSGPADRADARPLVTNNLVYVGTDSGLYALKPSGTSSFSTVWMRPLGKTVVSGPALAGGVIYVGGGDGNVYALDPTTGQIRWTHSTKGEIFSSPVVSGHIVYIGSEDGKLYALNTGS